MSRADLRVLVVDDQAERATGLSSLLRSMACKTSVGFNAAAGGRLFELFRPAIVLVSLQLADDLTRALIARVRAIQGPAGAMIVAYDEVDNAEVAARCIAMGFDSFVAKPLEAESLQLLLAAARMQRQESFERICSAAARLNSAQSDLPLATMLPGSQAVDGSRVHL